MNPPPSHCHSSAISPALAAAAGTPSSSGTNASPTAGAVTADSDEPPICGSTEKHHIFPRAGAAIAPTSVPSALASSTTSKSTLDDDKHAAAAIAAARDASPPFSRGNLTFRAFITPVHPLGPAPSYLQSAKNTICYSPLNVLLIAAPVSWALHYTHQNAVATFVTAILGIVPLAALLSFGTEEIALRTSVPVGGLLNASLGNLVEIIIAILALTRCELSIVQSSLLGGLLSNLLLVLGMSFLFGGLRFSALPFRPAPARLNSSLLVLSTLALLIPLAFHVVLREQFERADNLEMEKSFVLQISRGTSVILIILYLCYLVFTFVSHQHIFIDVAPAHTAAESPALTRTSTRSSLASTTVAGTYDAEAAIGPATHALATPKLNLVSSLVVLIATTGLVFFSCEALVDSIEGLTATGSVSKEWVSLIILPIVGNAAEHGTAIIAAYKGNQELAMSVALGSTVQIALFVIPLITLLGAALSKPLTLMFDPLESVVLFLSVLLAKFAVDDGQGRGHYLAGCVLCGVYVIVALVFWYHPGADESLFMCT